LEDWAEEIPGASWPEWGGHITLIPQFHPRAPEEEILAIIESACAEEAPFLLEFGTPVAVQDLTRRDYFLVLLSVAELNETDEPLPESVELYGENEESDAIIWANRDSDCIRLCDFRAHLLDALQDVREDIYPQLVAKPFRPHVTLAFALGENEAQQVVRTMRAKPITGEFVIEVVWLMKHGDGDPAQFERHPVRLGRATVPQTSR
jgi:hypothetical protein